MRKKYSQKELAKAKKLLDKGLSRYRISKLTGITEKVLRYHFVPGVKEKEMKAAMEWQKKNPEKNRRMRREYAQRLRKKNPEKVNAPARAYYHRNREKCMRNSREWLLANPDKRAEYLERDRIRRLRKRCRQRAVLDYFKTLLKAKKKVFHK